ncbi:MAG: serine/threonine-protein kinase [Kofleriaceae bacterium]
MSYSLATRGCFPRCSRRTGFYGEPGRHHRCAPHRVAAGRWRHGQRLARGALVAAASPRDQGAAPELSDRDDVVERFFDEARAAAGIADPGIVAVYDFGRHGGSAYIVMELLVGETLAARLARVDRLPSVVASRLALHAAMTMAVAHGFGIVHRDLKPDNLFLVPDAAVVGGERLKILDFGIAKLLAERDAVSRTQTGAILGTPLYMSPEQCRNAGGVDHRTDIYALGCVLFHMVCGRPPFAGSSSGDLIAAHLVDEPPSAGSCEPSVPAELDDIITRCLQKSADGRFASMSELALALAPCAKMTIDNVMIVPLGAGEARRPSTPRVGAPPPQIPRDVGLLTTLGTGAGEARVERARAPRRSLFLAGCVFAIAAIGIAAIRWSSEPNSDTSSESAPSVSAAGTPASTPSEPTQALTSGPAATPPTTATAAPPARADTPAPPTSAVPTNPPTTKRATRRTRGASQTKPTKTERARSPEPDPVSPVPVPIMPTRDHGAYELDD